MSQKLAIDLMPLFLVGILKLDYVGSKLIEPGANFRVGCSYASPPNIEAAYYGIGILTFNCVMNGFGCFTANFGSWSTEFYWRGLLSTGFIILLRFICCFSDALRSDTRHGEPSGLSLMGLFSPPYLCLRKSFPPPVLKNSLPCRTSLSFDWIYCSSYFCVKLESRAAFIALAVMMLSLIKTLSFTFLTSSFVGS